MVQIFQVQFTGLDGRTLRPGPKCIQTKQFMEVFNYINQIQFPSRLMEMICVEKKIKKSGAERSFAEFLLFSHVIRAGQLLPRYSEGFNPRYNVKVIEVNKQLAAMLKG